MDVLLHNKRLAEFMTNFLTYSAVLSCNCRNITNKLKNKINKKKKKKKKKLLCLDYFLSNISHFLCPTKIN